MDSAYPTTSQWTWAQMEPELTAQEKELRNAFVDQYLVDYDPIRAALRIGFSSAFAEQYAKRFMDESYVAKRISAMQGVDLDEDAAKAYDSKMIRNSLVKELNNPYTTGSARVAAVVALMKYHGIDSKTKEKEDGDRSGMMIVPAIANVDDWEKEAVKSQQKLAEDARSDIA